MLGIIDYKAGNLTSVKRALDYLGIASVISSDPGEIAACERIIFPGVGNAASAMETLRRRGLDTALRNAFARGTPAWEFAWARKSSCRIPRKATPPASGLSKAFAENSPPGIGRLRCRTWGGTKFPLFASIPF